MKRSLRLRRWRSLCHALVFSLVVFTFHGSVAQAATDALINTINVNTAVDEYDASPNATCSVREAVRSANDNADFGGCNSSGIYGNDVINIPAGTYTLTRDGIDDDTNSTADLDILASVTVAGAGPGSTTIKGKVGYSGRIIQVLAGTVVLKDMTLRDGNLPNGRAGAGLRTEPGTTTTLNNVVVGVNTADGNAGGILNRGTMTLNGSAVTNNQTLNATQGGGGIFNDDNATLTLIDSRVLANAANGQAADGDGGGIYNDIGSHCTLTNTTIADNSATVAGSSGFAGGGGIYAAAGTVVMIAQSTISGNSATGNKGFGGGADLEGNGSMTRSLVSGNSVTSIGDNVHFGGGLSVRGTFSINDSVIDGNSTHASINAIVGGGAAGIDLVGGAVVLNSTISNNHAFGSLTQGTASGGGILMSGGTSLINSTVIGNQADGDGGGIFFSGVGVEKQFVRNSTIVANTSNADGIGGGSGGGLYYDSGDVELSNTVIAGNLENGIGDHDDCDGPFSSTGYVLVQNNSGCTIIGGVGNLLNVNASLAALADNGGPTVGASNATVTAKMLTRSPASGSPLIDAGDPAGCKDQNNANLTIDQRGFLRPVNGGVTASCDIGAVEFGSFLDLIFADSFD